MDQAILNSISTVFGLNPDIAEQFLFNVDIKSKPPNNYFTDLVKNIPPPPGNVNPENTVLNAGKFGYTKKNKFEPYIYKFVKYNPDKLDHILKEPLIQSILQTHPAGKDIVCRIYNVYFDRTNNTFIYKLEPLGPPTSLFFNEEETQFKNYDSEKNTEILRNILIPFFNKYDDLNKTLHFDHLDFHSKNLLFKTDPITTGNFDIKMIDFGLSALQFNYNNNFIQISANWLFYTEKEEIIQNRPISGDKEAMFFKMKGLKNYFSHTFIAQIDNVKSVNQMAEFFNQFQSGALKGGKRKKRNTRKRKFKHRKTRHK